MAPFLWECDRAGWVGKRCHCCPCSRSKYNTQSLDCSALSLSSASSSVSHADRRRAQQ